MKPDEFSFYKEKAHSKEKVLDIYKEEILEIYEKNNFSRLNMASVYDCLEEIHGKVPCSEKSFRNYINHLLPMIVPFILSGLDIKIEM